ncbi:unnamed protein product [Peronospora destructor]|uniref:Uncharacterized protein n=1 Tax=Peronospora destructor TaxID=86335 RepID=A0AAV0TZV6_9STRA|nr:unnamed protein product [Peronospora destructor]
MELSRAESSLRTLKNRPKTPQGALSTALAILQLISPSESPSTHASIIDEETRRDLFQQELQTLLLYGKERWEPLAVFLVVVRDLLSTYLKLPDLDADTDFCLPAQELPLYVTSIAPLSNAFLTHDCQASRTSAS